MSFKVPRAPTDVGALDFIEGCMFAGIIRRRLRNAVRFQMPAEVVLIIFFFCSLNNSFGNCFAVLNEKNAENAEHEHNGAVNKQRHICS